MVLKGNPGIRVEHAFVHALIQVSWTRCTRKE